MSKTFDTVPAQKSTKTLQLQICAWLLSAATATAAIVAWGGDYGYKLFPINNYQLFPLLGLLAFGLMWAHYMVGFVKEVGGITGSIFRKYYKYTGYAVLLLICMHPALLIYQRFRDGYGLPPHSYESYVAPGLGWVTLLGTASFIVFIAFEFRRVFGKRSWWHFIPEAGDFAMLAILYHGFRLGGELRLMQNWYRDIWFFYAVTLVAVLIRSYRLKYFVKQKA